MKQWQFNFLSAIIFIPSGLMAIIFLSQIWINPLTNLFGWLLLSLGLAALSAGFLEREYFKDRKFPA